jgi:hypothetical protein
MVTITTDSALKYVVVERRQFPQVVVLLQPQAKIQC